MERIGLTQISTKLIYNSLCYISGDDEKVILMAVVIHNRAQWVNLPGTIHNELDLYHYQRN